MVFNQNLLNEYVQDDALIFHKVRLNVQNYG